MIVALLVPACAAPATPSARLPLEVEAFAFCRAVAGQIGIEAKADPARVKLLRGQAAPLLAAARRSLVPGSPVLLLLEAARGSLEFLAGEETVGEQRYGRAARRMALRWRECRKILPGGSPQLLPEYEALALLWELGGLRGNLWREEALRSRVALTKGPDPALEKDLAAAVEERYGPWLTIAELEPMLEFSGHLARLWLQERDSLALTERVANLALKAYADRVWHLAARKGAESLREDLGALLDRMDAGILAKVHGDAVLKLGETLLGTPQDDSARRLLKRLNSAALVSGSSGLRRRIAHLLGDWESEAALLLEGFRGEVPPEACLAQLREAASLLRLYSHAELLQASTRVLQAKAAASSGNQGESRGFREALEQFADLQREAGHGEESEALLLLRLEMEDAGNRDPEGRYRLLARLGRFAELEQRLGSPRSPEGVNILGWRFRCALGQGREEATREAVLAWIDAVLSLEAGAPVPNLPGLASVRPLLQEAGDKLIALAARLGPRLLPGQESLLAREPAWILVALDPETLEHPQDREERFRWRLNRLSGGTAAALEAFRREVEASLGTVHPMVAELILKQVEVQTPPDPILLERARDILEATGDRLDLQMAICNELAGLHGREGNGVGLEREGWRMLDQLESQETPDPEQVIAVALSIVMRLWREQRLDDLPALLARLERLGTRVPDRPGRASLLGEIQESRRFFYRSLRFLVQLRSAGLA